MGDRCLASKRLKGAVLRLKVYTRDSSPFYQLELKHGPFTDQYPTIEYIGKSKAEKLYRSIRSVASFEKLPKTL